MSLRRPAPSPRLVWLLCAALASAAPSAAQEPVSATSRPATHVDLAAGEHFLWLTRVSGESSVLLMRTSVTPEFQQVRTINGRIVSLYAAGNDVLAIFSDNSPHRFGQDTYVPELKLPRRPRPYDMVVDQGLIYALVPAATGRELKPTSGPASAIRTPADVSLVVCDGREWTLLADCPPAVGPQSNARMHPRLLIQDEDIWLVAARETEPARIISFRLLRALRSWKEVSTVEVPDATGMWLFSVSRVPALAVAQTAAAGGEQLTVYRSLGAPGTLDWSHSQITPSPLPEGERIARIERVVGFNQCVAALVETQGAGRFLQFFGVGQPPPESTVDLTAAFAEPGRVRAVQTLVQLFTLLLLFLLLIGFVIFRRSSLVAPAQLPANTELAFLFQRVGAAVIDFSLFAVPIAWWLKVDISESLGALAAWGLANSAESDLPAKNILVWWAVSVSLISIYAAVMELTAGRSIGKFAMRVHLLSESGLRPEAWQVLLRNALRPIELLPQFWIMAVLVIVSRNRQRIGDIFARTVVVRRLGPPVGPQQAQQKEDEGAASPPRDDSARPPGPTDDTH